jgi:peptidoglycan/LPS O-acetylase OafA/YrhL
MTMEPQVSVASTASDRRIPALDGLRGLAGLFVLFSHYFGEVNHGMHAAMVGWMGVDIFFVLSGYLIGKMILEKRECSNFFEVFYVRRALRIIPAYLTTLFIVSLLINVLPPAIADADYRLPLWSYFTFLQVIPMVTTNSIGAHWLSPTWTLAVEEHFYLLIPAIMVFTPRRHIATVLLAGVPIAVFLRVLAFQYHVWSDMTALVILPFRADLLICGLLAAVAIKNETIAWDRILRYVRALPLTALVATLVTISISNAVFETYGPLLVGIASASYILCLVLDAPEARHFKAKWLRWVGDNTYCIYLTHMTVLGLMHAAFLGTRPDIKSLPQFLVTAASVPVAILVGAGMTKLIEEPLTRYGRNWKWAAARETKSVVLAS